MGSLADAYGDSSPSGPSSGGRAEEDGSEPLVRPSSSETPENDGERYVGTALTLVGTGLLVVGIGIAFFSSSLPATLGYGLLVAAGAAAVAHSYVGSTPTAAVVVALAVHLAALAGRGRSRVRNRGEFRNRIGSRGRSRSSMSTRVRARRRSPLASLRDAVRRLAARSDRPGRNRRDRL